MEEAHRGGTSAAVIFADGFTPDARFHEKGADRVGAVICDVRADAPSQFTAVDMSEAYMPGIAWRTLLLGL